MKGFTFENQGTNTYLVYTIGSDDSIDELSLGMITNNKIAGILPVTFAQMDDKKYLKYTISSKIPVKQFFSGAVNKKRLLGVLYSVASGILAVEEYMIESASLILDLEYIYADVTTCEAWMVCLPVLKTDDKPQDLSSFFKNIVFSTQFDQTENCDYVARIISYLNSTHLFSLADFKRIVNELMNNIPPVKPIREQPVQSTKPQAVKPQIQYTNPQEQVISKPVPTVAPSNVSTVQKENIPKPPVSQNKPSSPGESLNVGFAIPGGGNMQTASKKEDAGKEKIKEEKYNKEKWNLFSVFSKKKQKTIQSPTWENNIKIPPQQPEYQRKSSPSLNQPEPKQSIPVQPVAQPAYQPVVQPTPKLNFDETTVLGGPYSGNTNVLSGNEAIMGKPFIVRSKNNERINIDREVFKIGKENSYVDYCIYDNSAVSRSHANIITHGDNYYVVDTNSKNRTFVDGVAIQSNTEVKISHGTKLRFANEEFEFRLY